MTTNDIEKVEILLCFKDGERALGVTEDGNSLIIRNNQKSTRK